MEWMIRLRWAIRAKRWKRKYQKQRRNMSPAPTRVTAKCCYSSTWQRFLGIPYRRYVAIEIVNHGWTQSLGKRDAEYMVLDWLICSYEDTNASDYEVDIEWL